MKAGDKSETDKVSVGAELIIPIASLLFAVYYLTSIWGIRWEAQVNGLFHSAVLLLLVIVFLIKTFGRIARGEADLKFGKRLGTRSLLIQRLSLIGLAAIFVVTLPYLGFTLGTFLFLVVTLYYFQIRSWKVLTFVPLGMATAGYILFIAALNARFPHGVVENLLAAIF